MSKFFVAVLLSIVLTCSHAFRPIRNMDIVRQQNTRVNENFGLDFAEDPYANTLPAILGEVNLKDGFVKSYKPDALLLSSDDDLILKIRKNQLLKQTVESGLLEALEAQGLTLSQVEKLLPVIDDLGLLPLAVKNKGLILFLAPLIVDTAFLGLPLAASVVGTPASTYSAIAFGCFGLAAYEGFAQDNVFLAVLLGVLGTPAAVLGSVLGAVFGDKPSVSSYSTSPVASSFSSPTSSSERSTPVSSGARVSSSVIGGQQNGKRKRIKVGKYGNHY